MRVATVGADGMLNVSIKSSGALLDDEHLSFADMFSRKTPRTCSATRAWRYASTTMKYVVRITVDSVWDMGPGPHAGEELL
jgi:hypothetical protein